MFFTTFPWIVASLMLIQVLSTKHADSIKIINDYEETSFGNTILINHLILSTNFLST